MKKHLQCLMYLMLLLFAALPVRAEWSEADGVYYIKSSDGLEEEFTVDGSVIYCNRGTQISGYKDNGVVFAPKNAGEVIQIEVEEISITGDNYVLVYDKAIEKIASGVSDGKEQSRYLPTGWTLKLQDGSAGTTHLSTDAAGKLSLAFHSASGATGTVRIKVSSIVPADMTYSGVSALNGFSIRRGAKDCAIGGFSVNTDGVNNPLVIDEMNIGFTDAPAQYANVRLYKGKPFNNDNLVASAGDGLSLVVKDFTLKTKSNPFYVVADILPDAKGTIAAPVLSNLKVAGEVRDIAGVKDDDVDISNVIYMTSGPSVFTIDSPVAFYDDGGPDGSISAQFSGTVTFVPSTPGSKIKVDVTKLDLFNTSSTGMNDVFKFYNGRTADEAQLITTLLKDTKLVKSTADDGSITVTLTSTTGYPKGGWEATVSEYVPGPMTLGDITAAAVDADKTVSSDEKGVAMFSLDIATDNNASPLKLEELRLASTTAGAITGLSVYSVGEDGTATLVSNEPAGLVFTPGKELSEGHNMFLLKADIAGNLLTDDAVNLSIVSVKVGGTERTLNVSASRKVKNVCRLTEGTHSHVINGTWDFMPEMGSDSYNSSKYAGGNTERTVTLIPGEDGSVIQMDFSKFDVYYASSSYGTKAKFVVYSGRTPDSANILWQLDSNDKSQVGPAEPLRSTAADGSMTVVFNPNTTSSYYLATGWAASVKNFKNHDMSIEGITVNQTSTAVLPVGSADAPMIDFVATTEGTLSTKVLKTVSLTVDGADVLNKVRVYASNDEIRANAVLFGEADAAATVNVNGSKEMAAGKNWFWVEADVKADAETGVNVDVALASLTDAAGVVTAVENGNPEGTRTTSLLLILGDADKTIEINRPVHFYDDGGADGKIGSVIGSSKTVVYTFLPGKENHAVTLNAEEFSIGNGRMYVYSGREVDNANILGTVTGYGTTTGPKNLVSKAADGSLTVSVKTPTGKTLNGFDIVVGLHEKVAYSLSAVEATAAQTVTNMVRGAVNVPLSRIAVTVDGDKGDSKVNSMTFDLTGTTSLGDITAAHLYYAGTTGSFAESQSSLLATVVPDGNNVTFTAGNEIGDNGTYYYFLTLDISPEAAAGNVVSAKVTGVSFNGTETAVSSAEAHSLTLNAGLKGTFSVGGDNADYATLASAVEALANGVEGAVTFNVADGEYPEYLTIKDIRGTSETSPVVFQSTSGNRDNVVIKPAKDYNHTTSVVEVENTPWLTLSGMTIESVNTELKNVVSITDRSSHFTLDNCALKSALVPSGYSGTYLFASLAVNEAGHNCDYMTLTNNSFYGGYMAANVSGTGFVALPRQVGAVIRDNVIAEGGSKGIYINAVDNVDIDGNVITQSTATRTNYIAIDVNRSSASSVTGNKIVTTNDNYSVGIYLRDDSRGTVERPILVANNDVLITRQKAYGFGVQIASTVKNVDFLYNTIRMGGTGGYALNISGNKTDVIEGINFSDNIISYEISATSSNSCAIAVSYADYAKGITLNNNVISAKNGQLLKLDSAIKGTVEELEDAGNGFVASAGNASEEPVFVGETDQHLSEKLSTAAVWSERVVADRDGVERSKTAPTPGAYEFAEIVVVKPEIAEGYPKVSNIAETTADVTTKWNVTGKLYSLCKLASDESVPAVDELLAVTPADATAETDVVTSFSGLKDNTSYRAYFLMVSSIGELGDVVASETFTTVRHIEPLTIVMPETVRINAGAETSLTVIPDGGDAPYTYFWKDQNGAEAGTSATVTVAPEYSRAYTVTVTSADGQVQSGRACVEVTGDFFAAGADDNFIEDGSYIMPVESEEAGGAPLYSGSLAFYGATQYYGSIQYWNGYAFSATTSGEFGSLADQYNSAPGGAYRGDGFIVAYPANYYKVKVTNNAEGEQLSGMYIANAAYAYSSMTNGDGLAKKFGQGDWYKVTVKGTAADGTFKTLDYYLADMRSENSADHYILDKWTWLDLSSLGKVTELSFTLTSSDTGQLGMNTPAYFAMDEVGGTPDMGSASIELQSDCSTVDLAGYFDEAPLGATVTYSVKAGEGAPDFTVDGSTLTISENAQGDLAFDVLVTRVCRGETSLVDLSVARKAISSGIGDINGGSAVRIGNTASDGVISIITSLADYTVDVYSTNGMLDMRKEHLNGPARIDCTSLAKGVYIVKIYNAQGANYTQRVIVK